MEEAAAAVKSVKPKIFTIWSSTGKKKNVLMFGLDQSGQKCNPPPTFIFGFLGPHPWHMEVPRLGVKLELQPTPQPWQHQIQVTL